MNNVAIEYAEALQIKFENERQLAIAREVKHAEHRKPALFTVQSGQKFDRIVQTQDGDSYGGAVHAFVEKSTGKLVKAAGWKAPAKLKSGELQSKFDLSTPEGFEEAVKASDLYGSYLYL